MDAAPIWYTIRPGLTYRLAPNRDGLIVLDPGWRNRFRISLDIDSAAADANSRLTGIRLAVLTTRLMELWRRGTRDSDTTMILVAVAAITAERFTRAGLSDDQKIARQLVPLEKLAPCNVSSIAAATGLNRETARRRVNALVKAGALNRLEGGEIVYPVGPNAGSANGRAGQEAARGRPSLRQRVREGRSDQEPARPEAFLSRAASSLIAVGDP